MASDLLDNETVRTLASVGAAAGALAFAGIGLMDTNLLADTAGLAGTQLDVGYAVAAVAGALHGWDTLGEYMD